MVYLILVSVAVFWRGVFLGQIVDDREARQHCDTRRGQLRDKKRRSVWFYLDSYRVMLYGAGLFKDVRADHLFNLVVHTINACLIYKASGLWLAGFLWLINPVNHQTSLWLNGRRYSLSLMLVLIGWIWWPVAPVAVIMAALLHVSGIVMPLLFLWTPVWPVAFVYSGLAALLGQQHIRRTLSHRIKDFNSGNENLNVRPQKIILYIKTVGHHFTQCLFPVVPAMYNEFLDEFGLTVAAIKRGYSFNFDFWRGATVITGLVWLIVVHHSFWAFWFLLFISPWCNVCQVTSNASDRYTTIAGVGLMVLLAQAIQSMPSGYGLASALAISVFYVERYTPLFRAYASKVDFYRYHLSANPGLSLPACFMADLMQANNDLFGAFSALKAALRHHPRSMNILVRLYGVTVRLGSLEKAREILEAVAHNVALGEEKAFQDFYANEVKELEARIASRPKIRNNIHNNGKPIVKVSNNEPQP